MKIPSRAELRNFNFQVETELKIFKPYLRTTLKFPNFLPVSWLRITNSNQLHDQLWIYVRQKGVLGSWKLWFNYINEKKSKSKFRLVFSRFSISSWREKGHKPSQAEKPSAEALAWASCARTHHYYLPRFFLPTCFLF